MIISPILVLSEVSGRSRVAGHEDYGSNRDVRLQKLLSRDDGSYCIRV